MYIVQTAFDKSSQPVKPIASIVCNLETKEIKFYILYSKSHSQKLSEVDDKIKELFGILSNNNIALNDYKSHLMFFNVKSSHNISETMQQDFAVRKNTTIDDIKSILKKELSDTIKNGVAKKWQELAADATSVYLELQNRGVVVYDTLMHPEYELTTFSGRSKSLVFGIQSTSENDDIKHVNDRYDLYVCADWMAADLRALSLLSCDKDLQSTFLSSDPYTHAASILNISKDEAKIELLRDINSLNFTSKMGQVYPVLYQWLHKSLDDLNKNKYLESILGRRFNLQDDNFKTVFNAVAQGSVAHAMHHSLYRLHYEMGPQILTELHDSIIVCCNAQSLKNTISRISSIMLHPFVSILESNPIFPLRISVGSEWKKWKPFKEYRGV